MTDTPPILIPFHISSSNHFVVEGTLNSTFARYILDTGAGRCCMGLHKAKEMLLEVEETMHTASGVGDGYLNRMDVLIPKMSIGGLNIEQFKVAGLDLSAVNTALEGIGESPVWGIIGADILVEYQAILDYGKQGIIFNSMLSVPFYRMKSNHLVFNVQLEGLEKQVSFIIDTGASQTCIDLTKAKELDYKLEENSEKATGTGSTKMPLSSALVPKVSFGDFDLYEYLMTVIDLSHVNEALEKMEAKPVDGIIGADILWKYRGVIDCGKKVLQLQGIPS